MNKYEAELHWWLSEATTRLFRHLSREQATYYSSHLDIPQNYQCGRLLDVGSGPILPARYLRAKELWCVDPLLDQYAQIGFPVRELDAVLVSEPAEAMTSVPSDYFDTIVAVNALDHIDDFGAAIAEIERVAKEKAVIRLRLHYHPPTPTEPLELNDAIVRQAFRRFRVKRITETPLYGQVLWSTV